MAEVAEEYVFAMSRALATARVLPSAVDDITFRVLRDRPVDIGGYVQSLQAALPSYFAPAPAPSPQEPAPGEAGYNAWFLKHAERIAAGGPLQPAAPEQETGTPGPGPVPKVLRRDAPGFDKAFVAHLEEVATGKIEVV